MNWLKYYRKMWSITPSLRIITNRRRPRNIGIVPSRRISICQSWSHKPLVTRMLYKRPIWINCPKLIRSKWNNSNHLWSITVSYLPRSRPSRSNASMRSKASKRAASCKHRQMQLLLSSMKSSKGSESFQISQFKTSWNSLLMKSSLLHNIGSLRWRI